MNKLLVYIIDNIQPLLIGLAIGMFITMHAFLANDIIAYYLILYSDK